jgi:hypothetical protein
MPNLANVVLTDRKATPVAHTFTPQGITPAGVATVIESSGVPVGNSKLSVSHRVAPASGKHKTELKLAIPVVVNETINGVTNPRVARTAYADVTFTFEATSTTAERNDLVGMLESALKPANLLVNGTVVNLEDIW